MNSANDHENLFLRSLDSDLGGEERKKLALAMDQDIKLQMESNQFLQIREMLLRKETDSFGPFFAERVVHQIKTMKKEIEYQIFFFVKKYQLVVVGVLAALLILNVFFSDELTINSILGINDETVDDIINVDVYEYLTE